jgi:serine/threonine-protein kinase
MDPMTEERVIQRAVAEGFVTAAELDEYERAVARWGARLSGMIGSGLLGALIAQRFLDDATSDVGREESEPGSSPRPVTGSASERFEIGEMLGQGGMAMVFKAYDHSLKRSVALKFLKSDDPDRIARFLREAQAQARVVHENVCKIYEVGELDGKPFIAMQLIGGKPLSDASATADPSSMALQMTVDQKARLMLKVAEGIHAAHREGLIHRDIKPSNIIVEATEDGDFKPYVLDFGLAREVASPGQTMLGLVAGTPNFMAPEQARGEAGALDRRTDVYGLGATLYAVLAGTPPFEGVSTLDVLNQVLEHEVAPLTGVPQDLATIVGKCLEKDPAQRYDSARAVAEDLARYLNGDPIQGRKTSLVYRLLKKARKHKKLAVASVLVGVAFLALGGWSIGAQVRSAARTRLAGVFGQEVRGIESIMQVAHLIPEHDIRPEKAAVRQRMAALEARMREIGSVAEAPGHYALGRGYFALGELEKAHEHLERAWNAGNHERPVAYSLGLTLGALYQKELEVADRIADKKQREERRRQVQADYRDPALRYLAQGSGLEGEAPEYVEALIAFYEKRYEAALAKAQTAYQRSPSFYEARALEANIYVAVGQEAIDDRGQNAEGAAALARAESAYAAAAMVGRSDPTIPEGLCRLTTSIIRMKAYAKGGDLEPEFVKALEASDRALAIDAEAAGAYLCKARVLRRVAEAEERAGQDPRPTVAKVIVAMDHFRRLQPGDPSAHYEIGTAYRYAMLYEIRHGIDPGPNVEKAEDYLNQAVQANPNDHRPLNVLGNLLSDYGDYLDRVGVDADAWQHKAETAYKASIAILPSDAALHNLALFYAAQASHQLQHGADATRSLAAAEEAAQRVLALDSDSQRNQMLVGRVHQVRAEYEAAAGRDPGASIAAATEAMGRALAINAKYPDALVRMAHLQWLLGRRTLEQGGNPGPMIEEATRWIARARASSPEDTTRLPVEAQLAVLEGRWQMARGRSPEEVLARSRKVLKEAIGLNAKDPDAYANLAEVEWRLAQWRRDGSAATQAVSEGLHAAQEGLAINPRHARALALRGALYLEQSRRDTANGKTLRAQALESLEQAAAINRFLAREYASSLEEARGAP